MGDNSVVQNTWWIDMVNSNHVWDLKNREFTTEIDGIEVTKKVWNQTYEYTLANGETIPLNPDDLGNMHFGAMGSLLFGDKYLKFGAGAAQGASNLWGNVKEKDVGGTIGEINRYINSVINGKYGDNPGDSDVIQRGIDDYRARLGL